MRLFQTPRNSVLLAIVLALNIPLAGADVNPPANCNPVGPNDNVWSKLTSKSNQVWKSENHNTTLKISKAMPNSAIARMDLIHIDCADVIRIAEIQAQNYVISPNVRAVDWQAGKKCKSANDKIAQHGGLIETEGLLCQIAGTSDEYLFWPVDGQSKPQGQNAVIDDLSDSIRFRINASDAHINIVFDHGGEINATATSVQ